MGQKTSAFAAHPQLVRETAPTHHSDAAVRSPAWRTARFASSRPAVTTTSWAAPWSAAHARARSRSSGRPLATLDAASVKSSSRRWCHRARRPDGTSRDAEALYPIGDLSNSEQGVLVPTQRHEVISLPVDSISRWIPERGEPLATTAVDGDREHLLKIKPLRPGLWSKTHPPSDRDVGLRLPSAAASPVATMSSAISRSFRLVLLLARRNNVNASSWVTKRRVMMIPMA